MRRERKEEVGNLRMRRRARKGKIGGEGKEETEKEMRKY